MEPAPSKEVIDNLIILNTETRKKLLLEIRENLNTIALLNTDLPVEEVIEKLEIAQLRDALATGFDFESFPILRPKLNKNTARGNPFYERYVGWTTEELFRNIYQKITVLKSFLANRSQDGVNLEARVSNVLKLMNLLLFHLDKKRTKHLCDEIKRELVYFQIPFLENVIVDDTFIADFILETEAGKNAFLVVLDWEPTNKNIKRAIKLLGMYKTKSDTRNGFVMLAGNYKSDFKKGLVSKGDLPVFIDHLLETAPLETQSYKPAPENRVFVAMPFDIRYLDTWVNIEAAAIKVGAQAVRVDRIKHVGNIHSKIVDEISQAEAIVADLSGSNPNVLYEMGFAIAMSKPCLQITSTGVENLPFDVKPNNTLEYTIGAAALLRPEIDELLDEMIN